MGVLEAYYWFLWQVWVVMTSTSSTSWNHENTRCCVVHKIWKSLKYKFLKHPIHLYTVTNQTTEDDCLLIVLRIESGRSEKMALGLWQAVSHTWPSSWGVATSGLALVWRVSNKPELLHPLVWVSAREHCVFQLHWWSKFINNTSPDSGFAISGNSLVCVWVGKQDTAGTWVRCFWNAGREGTNQHVEIGRLAESETMDRDT